MSEVEQPSAHLRNALTLLGALPSRFATLPAAERAEANQLVVAISKRMWKAVYLLEPQRARLAGGQLPEEMRR